MNRCIGLVPLLAMGCVTVDATTTDTVDVGDIWRVVADVDRGDIAYTGRSGAAVFDIEARTYATANNRPKARKKMQAVDFTVDASRNELLLSGQTAFNQAGVDVDVAGPWAIDLDLRSTHHDVFVESVLGSVLLAGEDISAFDVEGDVDIRAEEDVEAEIYPFELGQVSVRSDDGDCVVWLPRWAPVSIVAHWDPDYTASFADLDYDEEFIGDGVYEAARYPANIIVDIECNGGGLDIREHAATW